MKTTTEEPEFLLTTKPLAIQDLDIPVGNANVEVRETFTNYLSTNINWGVFLLICILLERNKL